ncbi:MAG: ABC transporter ATP-binding protein [Rhodospirillales bacterium]
MPPIVRTEELSRNFGAVVAADNITVAIGEGEVVGIIGANGAGKTTFVNMVTGYLKPSGGRIYFRDRDITRLHPRQVMRIGICRSFQIPQLFPELSVLDNLLVAISSSEGGWPGYLRPLRTSARVSAADGVLADYQLTAHRDTIVATLPQGVRKLVDIAMAMVGRPSVLLLDEPTSGVSVAEKFVMLQTIMAAVKGAGATVLFIEHDIEMVERYASRVLAFYDGRIIADADPETALSDPDVRKYVVGSELHRRQDRQ